MQKIFLPARNKWPMLMKRPAGDVTTLFDYVRPIMADVKERGDKALYEYSMRFDGYSSEEFEVNLFEIEAAEDKLPQQLKDAILLAKNNIEKFHAMQRPEERSIEIMPGVMCSQKPVPIEKVGLYIPGGSAPLFSTVLMLGIPAMLAGCKEIVMCTPPDKSGTINPAILYAAKVVGITRIFRLGGIQAIAAMTHGTETVPAVNKIFGPGNSYVMAAKQYAALNNVAIDMPAGPSEVLVIAEDSANPAFVAADLLSQAEHGADSQVIALTTSERMMHKIEEEVNKQLRLLPRREIAEKALLNSRLIRLASCADMVEFSNAYAPEHLIISACECDKIVDKITNAGSIFIGNYTPESAGDYASGTNHTLPTSGYAKSYSGVNLMSFMKMITIQKITPEGLLAIGPAIEIMAENEELTAHKNAISIRLQAIKNSK